MDLKILLEMFDKQLSDVNARAEKLNGELGDCKDEKRSAEILEETKTLASRKANIEEMKAQAIEADKRASERGIANGKEVNLASNNAEERTLNLMKPNGSYSYDTAELRSLLVSSADLAKPTGVGGINDNLNVIPSILNDVAVIDLKGMQKWQEAYVKTNPTAGAGSAGVDANDSDTAFGYVEMSAEEFNIVSCVDKNIARLSPLAYQAKVNEKVGFALRKKVADWIVAKIKTATDKDGDNMVDTLESVTAINQDTLRDLILNYGASEEVPGGCTLYLTKANLAKFGKVRGKNELRAIYTITPNASNPNEGIIASDGTSCRYVLCESAGTALIYGNPKAFELCLFGAMEITSSVDSDFKKRLIDFLGDTFIGGNVIVPHGFEIATIA